MLVFGSVVVVAEASVVVVLVVDVGSVGGIAAVFVGGAETIVGAVSGGWKVDSPYLVCNAFSNSSSVCISL